MRVLSIDPGYDRLGIAVVEKIDNQKETLLYSDCFTTPKNKKYEERLCELGAELGRVIKEFSPEHLASEKLFFAKNQRTAIDVAGARGVILYEAKKAGLGVYEYTPLQIKIATTGYGRSDKGQVTDMVKRLILIEKEGVLDDEYDAIAVGLTFFASERF